MAATAAEISGSSLISLLKYDRISEKHNNDYLATNNLKICLFHKHTNTGHWSHGFMGKLLI